MNTGSATNSGSEKAEPRPAGGLVALEEEGPLSGSLLWRLHDSYFEDSGINAWASGEVPHAISTSPILALAYARLVEGFAADCLAGRFGPIDVDEPLYVLEVGAGSGRLGFNFLKAHDPARVAPLRVVYVLTDRSEATIEFWSRAKALRQFAEAGQIDFAWFDLGRDDSLRLRHSGCELDQSAIVNPMAALANYLFDVQPQDLFAMVGESLHEELVAIHGDPDVPREATAAYLKGLRLALHSRPVTGPRYEGNTERVLRDLVAAQPRPGRRFLFAPHAIAGIEALVRLSSGRLLAIVGERPFVPPQPVGTTQAGAPSPVAESAAGAPAAGSGAPAGGSGAAAGGAVAGGAVAGGAVAGGAVAAGGLVSAEWLLSMGIHGGSISLPVDPAILAAATALGGGELLTTDEPLGLIISALVFGAAGAPERLRSAFAASVEDGKPCSLYFALSAALRDKGDGASLVELLEVLRMGRYDPKLMVAATRGLRSGLAQARPGLVAETVKALRRALELEYAMTEEVDLAFASGWILLGADRHAEALWFFERSTKSKGATAANRLGAAWCHAKGDRIEVAMAALDESLALDPAEAGAQQLRRILVEQLASRVAGAAGAGGS